MGYEVDYSSLDGEAKAAKALADCRSYLGDDFEWVVARIREEFQKNPKADKIVLINLECFIGIAGYPAGVLLNYAKSMK